MRDCEMNGDVQLGRAERLHQVGNDLEIDGAMNRPGIRHAGAEDDGNKASAKNFAGSQHAIEDWHVDVHDNYVRACLQRRSVALTSPTPQGAGRGALSRVGSAFFASFKISNNSGL